MKQINLTYGITGLIAVITGFLLKAYYRPFAYQNDLADFGFADSAPSFFYVIGFSQLLLLKKTRYPWSIILAVTLGSVAYELIQSGHSAPDQPDIIASVLGGTVSYLITRLPAAVRKDIP